MNDRNSYSGGVGFMGLLAILFIALKLTGVIDWSWVWVLAPVWAPLALAGVAIVVATAISLGITLRGEQ